MTYEFKCQTCKAKFELTMSLSSYVNKETNCPHCYSTSLIRTYSTPPAIQFIGEFPSKVFRNQDRFRKERAEANRGDRAYQAELRRKFDKRMDEIYDG